MIKSCEDVHPLDDFQMIALHHTGCNMALDMVSHVLSSLNCELTTVQCIVLRLGYVLSRASALVYPVLTQPDPSLSQ